MAKISRQVGTTSQICEIFIQNSSSTIGAGLTGLANNTSGLTCYYKRNTGSASVAVTLDAVSTLGTYEPSNNAHGAFLVVDGTNMPGLYEFQLPNNALATGADSVVFYLQGAANMAPCLLEVELTATNNQVKDNGLGAATVPSTPVAGTWGAGQYNSAVGVGRINTAQGGTSTTITLDAGASTNANSYVGDGIWLYGGTGGGAPGSGQFRTIVAYNTSTLVATVNRAWDTTPDNTTTFLTLPRPKSDLFCILSGLSPAAAGYIGPDWGHVNAPTTTNVLSGTTIGTLTTYTGNTPQTGDSYARIGATGSGLTSLAPSATALSTAQWTNTRAGYLDNLSAGAVAQAATALSNVNWTNTRAGYLDNLSVGAVAQASTALSTATWTNTLAGYLNNLSGGPVALAANQLTGAQIATSLWQDTTAGDFLVPNSPGHVLVTQLGGTFTTTSSSVFTVASLVNAPSGGGGFSLATALNSPRALDSIPDGSITVNDAFWSAVGAGVGRKDASSGTSYIISTPSTGTVLRTYALTLISPPSTVPDKAI